ncbi:MAG: Holliday junction resolvase RuvX [Bacteroidota bacterium]
MSRILAIDYGQKRTGLAVSDPMQIIASRLETIPTAEIWKFLEDYIRRETVERVLVGYPVQMNNQPSEALRFINPFVRAFTRKYPGVSVELVDERFTSKLAHQAMLDGGLKKSDRRNKALVDGISATIILQSWLEQKRNER